MTGRQMTLNVVEAYIDKITPTGLNPRQNFEKESMEELALSIAEKGVLEPLIVRQKGKEFELISGERRLKAAKMAGLKTVPIWIREIKDKEIREIMLLENLQRENLNPLEEAIALKDMIDNGARADELAKKLGKSEDWVYKRVRLLGAPEGIKAMLTQKKISISAVAEVLPFMGYPAANAIAKEIAKDAELRGGELTGPRIKDLIGQVIRRDAVHVLNFGELSNDWVEWHRKFDKKECRGCKEKFKYKEQYSGNVFLCLNKECFGPKVRAAKAAVKEQRIKADKKAIKKGGVLDLTSRGDWESLERAHFDTRVCKDCEHKSKGNYYGNSRIVCLNKACFNNLDHAGIDELSKRSKDTCEKIANAVKEYMKQRKTLQPFELRAILAMFVDALEGDVSDYRIKQQLKKRYVGRKKADTVFDMIALMPQNKIEEEIVRLSLELRIPDSEYSNDLDDLKGMIQVVKGLPEIFSGIEVQTHMPHIEKKE